jgi:hypothetical protein
MCTIQETRDYNYLFKDVGLSKKISGNGQGEQEVNVLKNKLKRFCIYYGWPSAVKSKENQDLNSFQVFSNFDILVFGAGLESSDHPDHLNMKTLITELKSNDMLIYGYVSARKEFQGILQEKCTLWKQIQGIDGIFLDDFGKDWGNSDQDIKDNVSIVRNLGLGFILNAYYPQDVGNNITLQENNKEFYLFESFGCILGNDIVNCETIPFYDIFVEKIQYLKENKNIGDFTLATTTNSEEKKGSFDEDIYSRYYYLANILGFHGFYWDPFLFSSGLDTSIYVNPRPLELKPQAASAPPTATQAPEATTAPPTAPPTAMQAPQASQGLILLWSIVIALLLLILRNKK